MSGRSVIRTTHFLGRLTILVSAQIHNRLKIMIQAVNIDTTEVVTECARPGNLTCELSKVRPEALPLPTALTGPAFTETIVGLNMKQKGSMIRVKLQKGGEN